MSTSLPNTVLNTIVAEAIDYLSEELEDALEGGASLEAAVPAVLQRSYAANKQVVFGGDNYSEEWHAEAEQRGLLNLRATPDALPYLVADDTETVFSNYGVLTPRELESRYEVFLEQYDTKINIESETAASIARTMLLPAAARHIKLMRERRTVGPGLRDRSAHRRVRLGDQGARVGQPRGEPAARRRPRPRQVSAEHGDPRNGRRARGG